MDDIGKQLEDMQPKCLDDIIRKNRDKASLGLISDDELQALTGSVDTSQPIYIKETIENWHLIALRVNGRDTQIMLLGDVVRSGNARITSLVKQIDLDAGIVRTQNSYYRVQGQQAVGEPDFRQLAMVCHGFRSWGFGVFLGVPAFFF